MLFLDNAPVHPVDLKLSNITILFFPPNTTSKIQPLDQGIIRCFKAYYRSRLVKHIISSCTMALTPDQVVITALDAVYWIEEAWNNVSRSTIVNTFRTAGFERNETFNKVHDDADEIREVAIGSASISIDDDPINNLDLLLAHAIGCSERISANEFVKLDEDIPVFDEWNNGKENLLTIEGVQNDEDDKDDEMIQEQPPSLVDALEMIRKLHLLASTRQPELHQLVTNLESKLTDAYIEAKTNKQSSITDFFRRV